MVHRTIKALRGRPLWTAAAAGAAVLLTGSVAAAADPAVVRGQGDLVSMPLTGGLAVVDARLEPLLVPGGSSDLVVTVRSRSAQPLTLDRVLLKSPPRDARPPGCVAKLTGPLRSGAGVTLTGEQRVVVGPGRAADLTVPSVLSLPASAAGGCGFRVTVEVRAVPAAPHSLPPTPEATPPTPVRTPPPPPVDCDPADPSCG
jgi:hypothetical protein